MGLRQLLYASVAATYLALSGCGASATQATTTTTAAQVEEPNQERECPRRFVSLSLTSMGIGTQFDSNEDSRADYLEIRVVHGGQILPNPIVYGNDLNGDGIFSPDTPGEIKYDPMMDGDNGNEMTPEQFERFRQNQREHPTLPLETRLIYRSLSVDSIVYASISPRS